MIMWHGNTDKIPTTIDVIIQGKNHFSYMINDGSFPAILVFASVFIITAFGKILFPGYGRDLIIIMIRCRYIKCSRLSTLFIGQPCECISTWWYSGPCSQGGSELTPNSVQQEVKQAPPTATWLSRHSGTVPCRVSHASSLFWWRKINK